MRIHIVTADVQDKDRYRDYTTLPPEKYPYLPTVREDTELQVEDEQVDHFVNVFGKMVRLEKETQ